MRYRQCMKGSAFLFNFYVYARRSIHLHVKNYAMVEIHHNALGFFMIAQAVNSMWYSKLSWVKIGAQNILAKSRSRRLCQGSLVSLVLQQWATKLNVSAEFPACKWPITASEPRNMSLEPIIQFCIRRKNFKNWQTEEFSNPSNTLFLSSLILFIRAFFVELLLHGFYISWLNSFFHWSSVKFVNKKLR